MVALKNLLIFTLVFVFISCNKKDCCATLSSGILPECIVLDSTLKTVKVQVVDNELHYWLNTDDTQHDGVEFVVNMQCDTVCTFCGECLPPKCSNDYNFECWVVIWKQ